MLVVTKVWEGRNALAYYENGILKMATHVSIWLPYRKTITGAYDLSHDMIFRRSRKFDNAAMPYALHITEGFFLHQWWSDGQPRSHWCIRVPGLYQKWLYEHLPKQKKADENSDLQPLWLETRTSRRLHQHLMNTHSRSWSITKFINTQHKNSFNSLHKSQQFVFMVADFLQVSFFRLFTHWFLREKKIIQIWK